MENKNDLNKLKKIAEYKHTLSPEEFNDKFKNILPNLEEYKNLEFKDSEGSIVCNLDDIFDSKIKQKIIKLIKQDIQKRIKFKEKEAEKRDKAWKKIAKSTPELKNLFTHIDLKNYEG